MKRSTPSDSNDRPSGLTDAIKGLRAGALDPAAIEKLAEWIRAELKKMGEAEIRRRGKPDGGVNDASDLANSVADSVFEDPVKELSKVTTTDELLRMLRRKLKDSWIARYRREETKKRHDEKAGKADQMAGDLPDPTMPNNRKDQEHHDLRIDMEAILDLFQPGSDEWKIVECLLNAREELSQKEIGERIGLSRDAVGRCVRTVIRPTLERAGFAP